MLSLGVIETRVDIFMIMDIKSTYDIDALKVKRLDVLTGSNQIEESLISYVHEKGTE